MEIDRNAPGDFRTREMAVLPPELRLPPDYPEPGPRSGKVNRLRFQPKDRLTADIRQLMRETGVTLYMILMAGYNILLHKYTGHTDIVIGSPISHITGRDHALEPIMVRNHPSGEKTFRQFLEEVKNKTLEVYEHREDPGRTGGKQLSYFALMVKNMIDQGGFQEQETDSHIPGLSTLDLTITAWESGEHLHLALEFNAGLFKTKTMRQVQGHFITILQEVVNNPGLRLADICMLTHEERRKYTSGTSPLYPLSHPQKRIYYTERMYPGTPVNTLAFTLTYDRMMDNELLRQALDTVSARNEGLRLRILEFDFQAEPSQYIAPYRPVTLELLDFRGSDDVERLHRWLEKNVQNPFHLINNELFNFIHIVRSDGRSILYMKVHHIIADGWTIFLLCNEITDTYEALIAGKPVHRTANPSYLHSLHDEGNYLQSDKANEDREFWRRTLLPLPEEINLAHKIVKRVAGIKGAVKRTAFPHGVREKILAYCNKNRTSIFKLILSALSLYIARVTGSSDIVVGSVNHNRVSQEQRRTAGMFASTIPFRVSVNSNMNVGDFIRKTGKDVNYILKHHQAYPFDRLIEELRAETGTDPGYLLNINLIGHPDVPGSKFELEHHFPGSEPTPLSIHINGNNKNLQGILEMEWDYQLHRYSAEDIERMHRGLINILDDALSRPESKLADIEMVSEQEKRDILYRFNKTAVKFPKDKSFQVLVEEQAEKTPDRIAVVFENNTLTYRQLNEQGNRFAHQLRERGVGPDVIVGLMTRRCHHAIAGVLAIMKSGGAFLPLAPDNPVQRNHRILVDSGTDIVLTQTHLTDNLPGGVKTIAIDTDERGNVVDRLFSPEPVPGSTLQDLAYVIYTSGSTGAPKGVMVTRDGFLNAAFAWRREYRLAEMEVNLLQLASFTVDVFAGDVARVLINGGKMVICPEEQRIDPAALCLLIQRHEISLLESTPGLIMPLMDHIRGNKIPIDSLQLLIVGSDICSLEDFKRLLRDFGNKMRILNSYGVTEATIDSLYYECRSRKLPANVKIPVGKPMANMKVYILSRHKRLQPVGIAGELCIGGAGVARGYLNRPELTAERFIHLNKSYRTYKTGDLARWLPCGNVELLGRIDRQVKIRGVRVEPEEIRERLLKYPTVSDAAVTAFDDGCGDKHICAYIVPVGTIDIDQLKTNLAEHLPMYMVPSYFVEIGKLPLSTNGKVNVKALPHPHARDNVNTCTTPGTKTERTLVGIFSEMLSLREEAIGIFDNFFDIGGHSLKAAMMQTKIHRLTGVKIPMTEIFSRATVSRLAQFIDTARKKRTAPIKQTEKKLFYPLSYAQQRLYMLHKREPGSILYNIPTVVSLEGELNIGRLDMAFRDLVKRHESFRTSFDMVDKKPVQRVHREVPFVMEFYDITMDLHVEVAAIVKNFIRPFDLSRSPLLRVGIIRIKENKHALMTDMHHIISDSFSTRILVDEFVRLYNGGKLPPLPIQYRDFTLWQHREKNKGLKKQEGYWLEQFNDHVPKLGLRTDLTPENHIKFTGSRYFIQLDAQLTSRINRTSVATGTTLQHVLLAIYFILLSRCTGQSDIVVGCPANGRSHADLLAVIGMFVNMMPLRNRPQGNKRFREFLREVSDNAFNAYENQDYPSEQLVRRLGLHGDVAGNPLFNVAFALQTIENTHEDQSNQSAIGGLTVKTVEFDQNVSIFDLTLRAVEDRGSGIISMELEYKNALFESETMEKYARHYIEIAQQVVKDNDILLKDITVSHKLITGIPVSNPEKNQGMQKMFNQELENE